MLDSAVVVREDRGSGTILEVRGAEHVARRAKIGAQLGGVARPALVNGAPGWVALRDGKPFAIAAVAQQNGRITRMDLLLDPARLAGIDLSALDPRA